ncbi:MAG: NAD(P)-binding protein [Candidatus Gastranaerophilales bacterium]|nr:NAD(P)-binding protein [Candidatus Gastranaerophilales bacterium]
MIRITQLKLLSGHTEEQLNHKIAKILGIRTQDIVKVEIKRQSIDGRKKPEIFYIYTVDVQTVDEESVLRRVKTNQRGVSQISKVTDVTYQFPVAGSKRQTHPVVIVGAGPAGLFCGYFLALHGYRPILLERGKDVEARKRDVERFWQTGVLDETSNVQFGEGGAGTFSDGKLNTLVKDKDGRNRAVLETFVRFGAKESILYEAKPHIGTDVLARVVRAMREEIIRLGGEVHFESQVTDIEICDQAIRGVVINAARHLACEQLVLAIGHSARDTFSMLYDKRISMEAKSFAVGLRVEHPQEMINVSQYGRKDPKELGAAAYKVTAKTSFGRGVYSFCMCPGGYVVNASSEQGRLAVNGMSYSGRDGVNANSAVIVAVTPADYDAYSARYLGARHPLAGVAFQRELEERAFSLAGGKIPVQRYGDFKRAFSRDEGERIGRLAAYREGTGQQTVCRESAERSAMYRESALQPQCKGDFAWADLSGILPEECNRAFVEGMEVFGRQIPGFDREDAILLGVESRTSSPVRIHRGESLQAEGVKGLYPCGEGAGYAGGITSAAMDGLRVAEQIAAHFHI